MANLPVPVPRTFTVSEVENAAFLNSIRDAITFLSNKPLAVLYQTTTQSLATGAPTAISLDTSTADTYGGHSNTTNNTRYTAQVAGWYWVVGTVSFANIASGNRGLNFRVNGAQNNQFGTAQPVAGTGVFPDVTATALLFLNVGDYVEITGYQDSGGAVSTHSLGSSMAIIWDHA